MKIEDVKIGNTYLLTDDVCKYLSLPGKQIYALVVDISIPADIVIGVVMGGPDVSSVTGNHLIQVFKCGDLVKVTEDRCAEKEREEFIVNGKITINVNLDDMRRDLDIAKVTKSEIVKAWLKSVGFIRSLDFFTQEQCDGLYDDILRGMGVVKK